MQQLLFLFFILFFITPASAQNLRYKVYKGEKKHIGDMLVHITGNPTEQMQIEIDTKVEVSFLATLAFHYNFISRYNQQKLLFAEARSFLNESPRDFSQLLWEHGRYRTIIDADTTQLDESAIFDTISTLYLREPINISRVFSERYNTWCSLVTDGLNRYKLTLPNGKHNYYQYAEGKCERVEVTSALIDLTFVLAEN
jgi:hypothetical protein